MLYENTLKLTLGVSIIIHSFLLIQLSRLNTSGFNKSLQKIEVSYYKIKALKIKAKDMPNNNLAKKYIFKDQISIKKEDLPSPVANDAKEMFKRIEPTQKSQAAIKQFLSQKRISMPEVKSEAKIKNPKYNNYYQVVRDKIRRRAYDNYLRYDTGEVYMVFVVLKNGALKDARIIDEKSRAGSYLKEVAIRSIKEASPYPNFPEGLSYPELSFNVIISFEISD